MKKKTKKKSKPALQGSAGSVLKKRFTLVEPELPLVRLLAAQAQPSHSDA